VSSLLNEEMLLSLDEIQQKLTIKSVNLPSTTVWVDVPAIADNPVEEVVKLAVLEIVVIVVMGAIVNVE